MRAVRGRARPGVRGLPLDARLEGELRSWEPAAPARYVLHCVENDLPDVRDEGLSLLGDLLAEDRR